MLYTSKMITFKIFIYYKLSNIKSSLPLFFSFILCSLHKCNKALKIVGTPISSIILFDNFCNNSLNVIFNILVPSGLIILIKHVFSACVSMNRRPGIDVENLNSLKSYKVNINDL